MISVTAAAPADLSWIVERTGCALTSAAKAIKAVDDSGKTRGMVAYDLWTESGCQAHMAVDTPIVWRSLVRPAFFYPFIEAGKQVVIGVIRATNQRSMWMTRALGFRRAGEIPNGHAPGVPLVIFQMQKDECYWLQPHARWSRRGRPL